MMNYDISDLNDKGVLKPGLMLMAVTAYLARTLFYGPLTLLAKRRGFSGGSAELDMSFLTVSSPIEFFFAVPAVLVAFAMLKRSALSGPFIRNVWRNGKWLLLLSVSMHLAYLLVVALGHSGDIQTVEMVSGVIDIYIVYFLMTSTRVRDVFAMFPEKESVKKSR